MDNDLLISIGLAFIAIAFLFLIWEITGLHWFNLNFWLIMGTVTFLQWQLTRLIQLKYAQTIRKTKED